MSGVGMATGSGRRSAAPLPGAQRRGRGWVRAAEAVGTGCSGGTRAFGACGSGDRSACAALTLALSRLAGEGTRADRTAEVVLPLRPWRPVCLPDQASQGPVRKDRPRGGGAGGAVLDTPGPAGSRSTMDLRAGGGGLGPVAGVRNVCSAAGRRAVPERRYTPLQIGHWRLSKAYTAIGTRPHCSR